MKLIFFLSFFLTINYYSYSQTSQLYLPLNFQNAIENGTRTANGKAGHNYWQNSSDYEISVELLPDSSYLIGNEKITYYNNSPDSLKELVIRLYQNISKVGSIRDWYVPQKYLNDGVKLNYLVLNGDTLDISESSREIVTSSTNLIIRLNDKIPPKSKIGLNVGWEFKISEELRLRMGNYGDGNYYVAYWYPQIAVYDDIDGWDKINYAGWVEFYNDFNNYDVRIKVPKGMVVWATGELQNSDEVLRKDIFEKYELAKLSDSTVKIIEQSDYNLGVVTTENEFNVWKYKAENVTDFTFATSKTFNWDGASVIVDSSTGRRALTDVVYKDGTIHYDKGAQYARATIEYLSSDIPGYPYPYSHATSYCNGNRGGGMESPMMANNGAPKDRPRHVGLIFHEIAHNYFPFMMGTNERKYAWMDEGWAAFLPTELVQYYDPDYDYHENRIRSFERYSGYESDLPLVVPSYSYKTGLG
ncbi:MAG: M1 family metallopeptidase, partial [Melioribacteraceae bacterium]|nr:M1 family metallopeptidase [Melioribacteraceae bacterium]